MAYYHESKKAIIDNLLNGGLSIIPATLIVIWQVRTENKNKVNETKTKNRERLKLAILSLLVFINSFPQLFEPRLRTSSLETGTHANYQRIVNLKKDIIAFKEEFVAKSNNLQTQLVYLEDSKESPKNITAIIKYCADIEFYLQKLISILNEEDLRGGLGYSELDYEEVIINMYKLKDLLCKLPDYLCIDKEAIESHLISLEYWHCVIEVVQKYLWNICKDKNKVTVSILRNSINKDVLKDLLERSRENQRKYEATEKQTKTDEDTLNDALRDCLKIFALRNNGRATKCCYYRDSADHYKLTVELLKTK